MNCHTALCVTQGHTKFYLVNEILPVTGSRCIHFMTQADYMDWALTVRKFIIRDFWVDDADPYFVAQLNHLLAEEFCNERHTHWPAIYGLLWNYADLQGWRPVKLNIKD